MQQLFALSLGIAAIVLLADRASGAECAPRDDVLTALADRYGEVRQAMGLASNGAVVELFASDATGSWTITATMANGVTCLVASGQNYEAVAGQTTVPGKPA